MPCATSAAKWRSRRAAWRPIAYARHEEPDEQRDHRGDAGEAQLLGDHREQEVGVRFGQVEELLDARAQAHAEPFAAAERDQRVRQLVALAERIGPRIDEAGDALQAIRRGDQISSTKRDRQQHRRGPRTGASRGRRGTGSPMRDRDDHHERAEVRLAQQQRRRSTTITANSGRKPRSSVCFSGCSRAGTRPCAPRSSRRRARRTSFMNSDGCRLTTTEREPAPRCRSRRLPMPGTSTSDQQHGAGDEQPRRELLPQRAAGPGTRPPRRRARRRRRSRGARGSTTRDSRCAPTPRPSRSTPNTPSRGRSRAAAASPTRATRRRRASRARRAAASREPRAVRGGVRASASPTHARARRRARARAPRSARRARRSRGTWSRLAHAGDSSTASPGARERDRARHRVVERADASRPARACPRARAAIGGASRPISSTARQSRVDRGRERREVLSLAVAAGDQHHRRARCRRAPPASRRRWCPWNRR